MNTRGRVSLQVELPTRNEAATAKAPREGWLCQRLENHRGQRAIPSLFCKGQAERELPKVTPKLKGATRPLTAQTRSKGKLPRKSGVLGRPGQSHKVKGKARETASS